MRQGTSGRRPRGRANRKQHLSPRSQTFDSSGPEVRVRGNAHQVYEKYLALARDATSAGDRIAAEGYYQFAEHYFRILNDSTDPQRANSGDGRASERRSDGADGQGTARGRPSPNGAAADGDSEAADAKAVDAKAVDAKAVDAKAEGNGAAETETDETPAEPEAEISAAKAKPRRRAPARSRKAASNGTGSRKNAEAESHAPADDSEPATT